MTNVRFTTVAEAAKFLDKKVEGWANKIDLKRFNMGSPNACVLGQLYGFYPKGVDQLGISGGEVFGGNLSPASAIESTIQKEWIEEINARLPPKLTPLQQAEKNIAELESKLQEEKAKLEALRNPEISVTLNKVQWQAVVDACKDSCLSTHIIAGNIDKQIGEQA